MHPDGSLSAGLWSSREASREDTSHERVSTLRLSTRLNTVGEGGGTAAGRRREVAGDGQRRSDCGGGARARCGSACGWRCT